MEQPKFEDSDACVYFRKLQEFGGDLDDWRLFVASMRKWDKTLVNAYERNKSPERE